ncbi:MULTISPECIES: aminoimidazole riboside kinase [Vibrio]|uniref:Aminoimidazole riboside kinase n=1 Tax=Vibrio rumoiensis TaxID=76258 RepID=A0ABW7J100_9VIBR|nr:aminoimidazole riboside kinase [Vibrio litoralis]
MAKVWVTGDAVVDLIPSQNDELLKCPGGAPANVAVGISRLGGEVGFIGRVGDDPFGRFIEKVLKSESVGIHYLKKDEVQRTSTVVIDIDDVGERSFTFMVKPSADQFIVDTDFPSFEENQWLHACSISLANEPSRSATLNAMANMKKIGGNVSFDPNIREEVWEEENLIRPIILEALALADVVKFSDDELIFLTNISELDEAISYMQDKYQFSLMVITQGKNGSLVVFNNEKKLISGKVVKPVDTTGAGDAFVGGLLYQLSKNPNWKNDSFIQESIEVANACGALATTAKGAMTALPNKEALNKFFV